MIKTETIEQLARANLAMLEDINVSSFMYLKARVLLQEIIEILEIDIKRYSSIERRLEDELSR